MANGMTRMINSDIVDAGVEKGRKPLKDQLASEFSPKRIAATKPENFKKKKASK